MLIIKRTKNYDDDEAAWGESESERFKNLIQSFLCKLPVFHCFHFFGSKIIRFQYFKVIMEEGAQRLEIAVILIYASRLIFSKAWFQLLKFFYIFFSHTHEEIFWRNLFFCSEKKSSLTSKYIYAKNYFVLKKIINNAPFSSLASPIGTRWMHFACTCVSDLTEWAHNNFFFLQFNFTLMSDDW